MNNIRPGDLAIVIRGLWPNIGRIVYVHEFIPRFDFSLMGLGIRDGWRVRSWGSGPLESIVGPLTVGITPTGSLRRIDELPLEQRREIEEEMNQAEIEDALSSLARYFERHEKMSEA